jgi:hypothetical protein
VLPTHPHYSTPGVQYKREFPVPDITIRPTYSIPFEGQDTKATFLSQNQKPIAEQFTHEDLRRSGLTPEDMGIRPALHSTAEYSVQYYLPYFYPDGNPITDAQGMLKMYRTRGTLTSKGVADGRGKYNAPGREAVGELSTIPYLHPKIREVFEADESRTLAICEGEKKAVSLMKFAGIAAIGIGGKDNWHLKGDQSRMHPWIQAMLEQLRPTTVLVVPDGDVRKFHIAQSFGSLASLLRDTGYEVAMPLLPNLDDKVDDLIAGPWQGEDIRQKLLELPPVHEFVETTTRLRDVYHLQTVMMPNGGLRVPINEANLARLVEHHPSFDGLWFNEDDQTVYVADKELSDTVLTGLLILVQRSFSMPNCPRGALRDVVEQVARERKARSPWKEYIAGLTWDGVPRLDSWLVNFCNAKDTEMAREGGLKWLVGAVARVMEPGAKVDYMLVTVGAQGIGKSSLPNILWNRGKVRSISGHLKDVDLYTAMHSGHCANWEELAAMSRYELEHFNTIITETHDVFRPKYGRTTLTQPRRFVLYGSTNTRQFLNADPTGHRRYVIVELGQVKFAELERITPQLWAEAVHLYREGQVDYTMVTASRTQGTDYVDLGHEYDTLLDAVLSDYQSSEAKVGAAVGEVKDRDGRLYYCGVLGDWRQRAGLSAESRAASNRLNRALQSQGWIVMEQAKINGRKRSRVWGCPVSLLR